MDGLQTPSFGAYRGSPLSPANPVSAELKSDPIKTSELLNDIATALASPLPMPADCVRQLEADLVMQATPAATPWQAAAATGTPSTAAVSQTAKDLVASLEALLQQPAATPGRAAITALRRSTTTELTTVGSSAAAPGLAEPLSFVAGRGEAASGTAAAAADCPAATPGLLRAPTSRWHLAAERAASFRSPPAPPAGAADGSPDSSSRSITGWQQVSFAAPGRASRPATSPAADLLAEIARTVSPTASPAGRPFQPAAAAPSSPVAVPSFSSPAGSAAAGAAAAAAQPASPLAYNTPPAAAQQQAADSMGSPQGGRWQAVASGRPAAGAAGGSIPASPVASFGFAAHSPAPLLPVQLDLRPPGATGQTFAAEAARVLEELFRFPELERSNADDFTAGLAVQLERLFAPLPPPAALERCLRLQHSGMVDTRISLQQ